MPVNLRPEIQALVSQEIELMLANAISFFDGLLHFLWKLLADRCHKLGQLA